MAPNRANALLIALLVSAPAVWIGCGTQGPRYEYTIDGVRRWDFTGHTEPGLVELDDCPIAGKKQYKVPSHGSWVCVEFTLSNVGKQEGELPVSDVIVHGSDGELYPHEVLQFDAADLGPGEATTGRLMVDLPADVSVARITR